jgi:AmmeMemoRadiSam system protein B/AmmeMemoRadiSam system protein A
MAAIHISPYSGSWYPASADELARLLDEAFERSRRRVPYLFPDGLAYVTPHAGPAYSGGVAAAVYRALALQRPERVVVLAFPHHGGLRGVAVPDVDAVRTPLGDVPVDRAEGFPVVTETQLCDHSFEIQLPFLQRAVPGARVTPVYVGRMEEWQRHFAAAALAALWRPGTVFLASSDFTHYGRSFRYVPFPADGAVAARLRDLDQECIDAAGSLNASLFLDRLRETGATVCGAGPIALLLDTVRTLDRSVYQVQLDYETSGDVTGDFEQCVSYAALGYYRPASFHLPPGDCEALLESASRTLNALRQTGSRDSIPAAGGSPALQAHRGAFVSLHRGTELLGCVGNPRGRESLAQDVADLALNAALDDSRFTHATDGAWPIDIEISVLTPSRAIRSAADFEVGRHGALLGLGGSSGLLLPQVADRRSWTAAQFIQAVCRKAGVRRDGWRDPKARLYTFEAQVFSRPGLPARS